MQLGRTDDGVAVNINRDEVTGEVESDSGIKLGRTDVGVTVNRGEVTEGITVDEGVAVDEGVMGVTVDEGVTGVTVDEVDKLDDCSTVEGGCSVHDGGTDSGSCSIKSMQ